MKTVLVTRSKHQAAELIQLLENKGYKSLLFPMIEIVSPPSWEICDKAISTLYMYDGVIFTSANGVGYFCKRLTENNVPLTEVQSKFICVVGEKTKETCEKYGLIVTLMPDKFTSNDLFRALQHRDVRDRAFLYPRGNLGKESLTGLLKSLGAKIDPVTVYHTIQPEQNDIWEIKTKVLEGAIDVLTFMSPSSIKNFTLLFTADELRKVLVQPYVAVIGPVTEQAAIKAGFTKIIIASKATVEGLVETIDENCK